MSKFTPSELVQQNALTFQTEPSKSITGRREGQSPILMCPLRLAKQPFQLVLKGQMTTNGIIINNQFNTHSFAFKFDTLEDALALESLTTLFEDTPELVEYEFKHLLKNDQMWIKCKFNRDKSSYNFQTNFKFNPKKPGDAPLYSFTDVVLTTELTTYVNVEDRIYGFSINLRKMELVHNE